MVLNSIFVTSYDDLSHYATFSRACCTTVNTFHVGVSLDTATLISWRTRLDTLNKLESVYLTQQRRRICTNLIYYFTNEMVVRPVSSAPPSLRSDFEHHHVHQDPNLEELLHVRFLVVFPKIKRHNKHNKNPIISHMEATLWAKNLTHEKERSKSWDKVSRIRESHSNQTLCVVSHNTTYYDAKQAGLESFPMS